MPVAVVLKERLASFPFYISFASYSNIRPYILATFHSIPIHLHYLPLLILASSDLIIQHP